MNVVYFTDPIARQFERAWENARLNAPERCTQRFIEKWFNTLMQQGVVKDFSVHPAQPHGFDLAWEAAGGGWKFFHAEAP